MARLLVLALILVLALAGCGGDSDEESASPRTETQAAEPEPELLPEGGEVPEPRISDLEKAARVAECELVSTEAGSRNHTDDIEERIDYDTNPPTAGRHFQLAAEDGVYEEAPPDTTLVHSHEHGRVVVWFRPSLPERARAGLLALVEDDDYQMLLVPRPEMPFVVAATAWNAKPGRDGTGRLLGCRSFTPAAYDAIAAFRDRHRSRGPEATP